ncbi:MAG: DUF4270 family protein [Flavobacteriales bacterium]
MMEKRSLPLPITRFLFGAFSAALLVITGCEKPEERQLGKDALPKESRMASSVTDTFRIESRSVSMRGVPASQSKPAIWGQLQDSRTGRTKSTFYTQLLLPSTNIDLGNPNDLVLDSAVLRIRYKGYYGDTSAVQDFRVHQVLEDMEGINPTHRDSLSVSANTIGSAQLSPSVTQEVSVDGGAQTLPPHLRVRLNDNFGENILDRSGQSELSDNDAFTDYIKGISISSQASLQSGEGTVLYGQIPHDHSRVTLHYRNTATGDTGALKLELGGAHFNRMEHDAGSSDIAPKLDSAFSAEQNRSYVIGPGEVATQLRFPTLRNLDDSTKISINKARLKLPVKTNAGLPFPPPSGLHVLYKTRSGELALTKDRKEEGGEFIGGAYEEKENHYAFRITRHVQAIMNEEVDSKAIYLTTSLPFLKEGEANTVARAAIKGPASSEPPTLEVTYTEY